MIALVLVLALALAPAAAAAATITIVNLDGPNEGFNDPAPRDPVGGNPETTLGAQRLYVFQFAANIWGGLLNSNVEIRVNAQFSPMTPCTPTGGVLGGCSPASFHRDFANRPLGAHWYHQSQANALAGSDLSASNDMNITFNSSIGEPTCLPSGWYLGVDGSEGAAIELLPVVLHELGHGLGFSTSTNGQTGVQLSQIPHAYDHFLYDNTQGMHWDEMTEGQRAASALNCRQVAWDGANATEQAPLVLGDKPLLRVTSPPTIAGDYDIGLASFGAPVSTTPVSGQVVLVNDGLPYPTNACEPLMNAAEVAGKIALVDRGTCPFVVKVKNAQDAGAIAVLIADSLAGCPPVGMSGVDPSIVIPAARITLDDGATLKSHLAAGVDVALLVDPDLMAGADDAGRVLIYTPNPYQGGSSVSHWDTSAEPSLLMEPASTPGLSRNVDLTSAHFRDLGWPLPFLAVGTAPSGGRLGPSHPNPAREAATIMFTLERAEAVDLAIYDAGGRLVNRLMAGTKEAGPHTVRWDGRDLDGRPVATGIYLYRLRTSSFSDSRPLAIVR